MLHKNGIYIDPVDLTIAYEGKKVGFQKQRGRSVKFDLACRLIIGRPATNEELFDAVYGDDPDGGPDCGLATIRVHTYHLQRNMERIGLKVHAERGGEGGGGYVRKWIGP